MTTRERSLPVPRFRRSHLAWHRRTGRVVAVAGLLVAISALWLTLSYQAQPGTGDLLYVLRLAFGSAMAACLVLGFTAVRRGDIVAHRAWMIRGYAIGLAAGTQAVAEWALHRPVRRRAVATGPQQAGALS